MNRLTQHVRSNVVAYLALFVALGGTGYAAINLPANSVGGKQIKDHSITPAKFNRSLIGGEVRAWANVNADGRVLAGGGKPRVVVQRGTGATGHYTVFWKVTGFKRCAAIAGIPMGQATGPGLRPRGDGFAPWSRDRRRRSRLRRPGTTGGAAILDRDPLLNAVMRRSPWNLLAGGAALLAAVAPSQPSAARAGTLVLASCSAYGDDTLTTSDDIGCNLGRLGRHPLRAKRTRVRRAESSRSSLIKLPSAIRKVSGQTQTPPSIKLIDRGHAGTERAHQPAALAIGYRARYLWDDGSLAITGTGNCCGGMDYGTTDRPRHRRPVVRDPGHCPARAGCPVAGQPERVAGCRGRRTVRDSTPRRRM